MPYLPQVDESAYTQIITRTFAGYNRNPEIGEGQQNVSPASVQEFYDTKNLTSDNYPMMSTRVKRGTAVSNITSHGGCFEKGELVYVDNGKLYYNKTELSGINLLPGEKQFVSLGSKLIIWPDKIAVDINTGEPEYFEPNTEITNPTVSQDKKSITSSASPVVYRDASSAGTFRRDQQWQPLIATYGNDISQITYNNDGTWTLPAVTYKSVWSMTGSSYSVLLPGDIIIPLSVSYTNKIEFPAGSYSGSGTVLPDTSDASRNRTGLYAVYKETDGDITIGAKIVFNCFNKNTTNVLFSSLFSVGDSLTVTDSNGATNTTLNTVVSIVDTSGANPSSTITFENELTNIPSSITSSYKMEIKRPVPDMDYITEASNRIWGCKYGIVDGKNINEIYACELGDYRHWYSYKGISTDSYAASIGTDGEWTGAVKFQGNPIFFKENGFHKVYVSGSGAHQIVDQSCIGVQSGCSRSIAVVGSRILYKSRSGVMSYDGSLPQLVSKALGDTKYKNAAAGSIGNKYYISMQDEREHWNLFVLDTEKWIWQREDETHASSFARVRDELYFTDIGTNSNSIKSVMGSDGVGESPFEWIAETGMIGYTIPEHKYVSRFNIRMSLPSGSNADIYIQYDSDGIWNHSGHIRGVGTNSFMVPVRPRRCDHFSIRIEGTGECRVYSISKIIEKGSDVV